jgi:2-polyprenyl-6-methoxyphenol hydroxylase-like FAD-dependent oxidoreductase
MHDELHQSVPNGILQIQPELGETLLLRVVLPFLTWTTEKSLREEVEANRLCELRLRCDVQQIEAAEDDRYHLQYTEASGVVQHMRSKWLIGADGKRGIVRKGYLEKAADIRQVEPEYRYEGTWVAANLHIINPTPKTHPDLPFWNLGMTPEEVYDLYWPKGWHFCSPPGKPTAGGRFGPHESHVWRHEFRQDAWDPDTMDAEQLFWEHITPMITRTTDARGRVLARGGVTWPRDCIEIRRCRPFTFAHKVVNKWFSHRAVLIGDAAHVFPPFGGQGIASGVRDAQQLAWRIALLEKCRTPSDGLRENLLGAWARERTRSIKDAATLTSMNGALCNQTTSLLSLFLRLRLLLMSFPWLRKLLPDPQASAETTGFQPLIGACCLPEHGGGGRLPQIYIDSLHGRQLLSDTLLAAGSSIFTLLVLQGDEPEAACKIGDVRRTLSAAGVSETVLSPDSISTLSLRPARPDTLGHFSEQHTRKAAPTPVEGLAYGRGRPGYSDQAIGERFGEETRFLIVRPDFYVFATAQDLAQLGNCCKRLAAMLA